MKTNRGEKTHMDMEKIAISSKKVKFPLWMNNEASGIHPKKSLSGMFWWKCPRCHGEDVFPGKRPAGNDGSRAEVGDTGNLIAVLRQVLVDLWVCCPCGGITTKSWQSLTGFEIDAEKAFSEEMWSGPFLFQMAGLFLLFFCFVCVMLRLLVDIFFSWIKKGVTKLWASLFNKL